MCLIRRYDILHYDIHGRGSIHIHRIDENHNKILWQWLYVCVCVGCAELECVYRILADVLQPKISMMEIPLNHTLFGIPTTHMHIRANANIHT